MEILPESLDIIELDERSSSSWSSWNRSWDDFASENRKRSLAAICFMEANNEALYRETKLYRKRWDEDYLWYLAVNENSFVTEYRLDPRSFDILHELLRPLLEVNEKMAKLGCGSSQTYTTRSQTNSVDTNSSPMTL